MNQENELKKIFYVTLVVIAVAWQSALWFKMDAMLIRMKYMNKTIEMLDGGYCNEAKDLKPIEGL